jgi:tagatose 6-phosphate kinase
VILTVTLNAALDVTYHVPALRVGTAHRISTVDERAGGKGVNVARVLHALGEPVLAAGLVGGSTGSEIRSLLSAERVRHSFVDTAARSRRTVVVADGTEATGFWEPGPTVCPAEWAAFVRHFTALLKVSRVAVLSGSLPPGVAPDAYGQLVLLARRAEVPVILDADGAPLLAGIAAGPTLVKPNAHELATAAGVATGPGMSTGPGATGPGVETVFDVPEAVKAAEAVRAGRPVDVVASLGPHGVVACTPAGRWHAAPAEPLPGNPTGAGDACVAALARGVAYRLPWPVRLADAVGLSAAAVASPVAGSVSLADFARLRRTVTIREL